MKKFVCALTTIVLLSTLTSVFAATAPATRWVGLTAEFEQAPEIHLMSSNGARTQLTMNLYGLQVADIEKEDRTFQALHLATETGYTAIEGAPELPLISKLVALPSEDAQLTVTYSQYEELTDFDVMPAQPAYKEGGQPLPFELDETQYNTDAFFPAEIATLSEPMIMRDLRLANLTLQPVQYNPVTRTLRVYTQIEVEIETNGASLSQAVVHDRPLSKAFDPIYRATVLNYDEIAEQLGVQNGLYLVICPDAALNYIQPLVDWRHRMGHPVKVVPLSEIGSNPSSITIKAFIQNEYNNSEIPVEYIVLVGDESGSLSVPDYTYSNSNGSYASDHKYTLLSGTDYLADAIIGRISVDNANLHLSNYVGKVLGYEQASHMSQTGTDWYTKACLVSGNVWNTITTKWTNIWVMQQLEAHGYTEFDTIFNPYPYPITQSINSGVSVVNYRGTGWPNAWGGAEFEVNDVLDLQNGWQTPIVTSVVCGTGDYGSWIDPCFGEAWIIAGTPTSPRGGVAFFGATDSDTHTKWNNPITIGFYWGLLEENMYRHGQCMLRGKILQYHAFPGHNGSGGTIEQYHHTYNMLGDPALQIRTAVPENITADIEEFIPFGQNHITITVSGENGQPLPDAQVCILKEGSSDDEVFEVGMTDDNGEITLLLSPETPGTLKVTVTKPNTKPIMEDIQIIQMAYQVGLAEMSISDDSGDTLPNPGESIDLTISLENFGQNDVTGVTATLTSLDEDVTITGDTGAFGAIGSGDMGVSDQPFSIVMPDDWHQDDAARFELQISDDEGHTWTSQFELMIHAPVMNLASTHYENTGDNYVDPGETIQMYVVVENRGDQNADNVTMTLENLDSFAFINQGSAALGDIEVNGTSLNATEMFELTIHDQTPVGRQIPLRLNFTYNDGHTQSLDTILPVGHVTSAAVVGPDLYGYYAYDNDDPEEYKTSYDWIEIDPSQGGSGTVIPMADDSKSLQDLPFTFTYYGRSYDQLIICSNGWFSFGTNALPLFRNWQIPNPIGPEAQVMVFWDDLDATPSNAHVCTWYDEANSRYIIEWNNLPARWNMSYHMTFQAILYDPAVYETVTGDGEILMQFKTIQNYDWDNNYGTSGIESPDQNDGIQYHYASMAHPAGRNLTTGTAVLYTTNPPFPETLDVDDSQTAAVPFGLDQNYPNPFVNHTRISYQLPQPGAVTLQIFNSAGQLIRTMNQSRVEAGQHELYWDGRNETGNPVGSGVYFYRLQSNDADKTVSETRRMVLMR